MKGVRGEVIAGRYEVGEQIGSGGFGTVYAGRQLNLNRDVAIKVMRQGPEGAAVSRERFRREAVLSSGFSHPNIVTYHDFVIDDDGDMILVMEFLRGVTLDRALAQEGRLEIGRAARLIAEVAAGLAECHRAGIVHRDIKPSNIFVLDKDTPRERAKIIDFGILWAMPDPAGEVHGLTRDNAFIGTPEYVAPEVLIGAYPDGRTDQYALAMVALRAMTGELPFKSSKGAALLDRVTGRPPVLGSERLAGAAAVRGVLYKALSPVPGDRFGDMDEFGRAMAAAAGVVPGMAAFPMPTPGVFGADSDCADDTVVEVRGRGRANPPIESEAPVEPVASAIPKGRVKAVAAFATVALCAVIAVAALMWGASRRDSASSVSPPAPQVFRDVAVEPIESPARPQAQYVEAALPAAVAPAPVLAPVSAPVSAPVLKKAPVAVTPVKKASAPSAVSKAPEPVAAPVVATPVAAAPVIPEFGTVTAQAEPFAYVWIGGRNLGISPVTVSLPVGRHTIEFRSDKYGALTRTVEIMAGQKIVETVNLKH